MQSYWWHVAFAHANLMHLPENAGWAKHRVPTRNEHKFTLPVSLYGTIFKAVVAS